MFLFKRASPLRRPPSLTTSNILHGQRQRPRGTGFAVGSAIIIVQIFLRRAELSCAGFGMPGGPAMVSGCSGGVSGRVLGCHCRDLGGSWGDACDLWGGGVLQDSSSVLGRSWGGLGATLGVCEGYLVFSQGWEEVLGAFGGFCRLLGLEGGVLGVSGAFSWVLPSSWGRIWRDTKNVAPPTACLLACWLAGWLVKFI